MTVRQLISKLEILPNNAEVHIAFDSDIRCELDKIMIIKNPDLDKWKEYDGTNIVVVTDEDFELDGLEEI